MALVQLVAPTTEPVTLDAAKEHLRVEYDNENSLIDALIATARQRVEKDIGAVLVSQQWTLSLDRWGAQCIDVPLPPLVTVDAVRYVDSDGVTQVLDPSSYRVDIKHTPGRLTPAYGTSWPAVRSVTGAIEIDFTAGYSTIPPPIKHAILLYLATLYENRETFAIGSSVSPELPHNASWLLEPYRVVHL